MINLTKEEANFNLNILNQVNLSGAANDLVEAAMLIKSIRGKLQEFLQAVGQNNGRPDNVLDLHELAK